VCRFDELGTTISVTAPTEVIRGAGIMTRRTKHPPPPTWGSPAARPLGGALCEAEASPQSGEEGGGRGVGGGGGAVGAPGAVGGGGSGGRAVGAPRRRWVRRGPKGGDQSVYSVYQKPIGHVLGQTSFWNHTACNDVPLKVVLRVLPPAPVPRRGLRGTARDEGRGATAPQDGGGGRGRERAAARGGGAFVHSKRQGLGCGQRWETASGARLPCSGCGGCEVVERGALIRWTHRSAACEGQNQQNGGVRGGGRRRPLGDATHAPGTPSGRPAAAAATRGRRHGLALPGPGRRRSRACAGVVGGYDRPPPGVRRGGKLMDLKENSENGGKKTGIDHPCEGTE